MEIIIILSPPAPPQPCHYVDLLIYIRVCQWGPSWYVSDDAQVVASKIVKFCRILSVWKAWRLAFMLGRRGSSLARCGESSNQQVYHFPSVGAITHAWIKRIRFKCALYPPFRPNFIFGPQTSSPIRYPMLSSTPALLATRHRAWRARRAAKLAW